MARENEASDASDPAAEARPRRAWTQEKWWLPVTLILAVVIFIWMSTRPPDDAPPADDAAMGVVSLAIEFGDGETREFADLPWRDGMTIADLMIATGGATPDLEIEITGRGEMAFLTTIDGVAGEAGEEGRNWIVYVNGEKCQRGIGATQLEPNDAVLWKYEPFE